LLLREGEAGDRDSALPRQVEREPAPAAADVENMLSRLQKQLRGEVPLLVELRRVEILVGLAEISTGILPVGVEEETVEAVREVVMMRDIGARPALRIVLLEPAQEVAEAGIERPQGMVRRLLEIARQEVKEVVDGAVLDGERAVHIGLA